ncbi:MAG: glycosyltransferase family 2 protein [Candidatus Babeliaceae bacterium]|nr:glycosyltransferase family 2 protein [Candidatus Babeliaceae bacterium]
MSSPLVKISVGMPVYNGEEYLESAIQATLKQTYEDFELIVSDNASTDRTESICRDFAESDSRIRYVRNEKNIGAAGNYNQLFRLARGEYFRWFNADDLCSEFLHEKCLSTLEAHPDAVLAYGKTDIIDGNDRFIEHYEDNLDLQMDSVVKRFLTFFHVVGMTNVIYGLMRRSALQNTLLMGNGSFPAADTNLMGELTLYGKFIEIPEILFYRRIHEDASSWDRNNTNAQQMFWTGGNNKYVMPTLKKDLAYLRAILRSPNGILEKLLMETYILRRIFWNRRLIWNESLHCIQSDKNS